MLRHRFIILVMGPHWKHLYIKTLTELGVSQHCAAIRWIDATPDNQALMVGKEADIFPALEAVARRCIVEDGVEAMLGMGLTRSRAAYPTSPSPRVI